LVAKVPDNSEKIEALVEVAGVSQESPGIMQSVWAIAESIPDPGVRTKTLLDILAFFDEHSRPPLVKRIWEVIPTIESPKARSSAMERLIPFVNPQKRLALISEATNQAETIQDADDRCAALIRITAHEQDPAKQAARTREILATIPSIDEEDYQASALVSLAMSLPLGHTSFRKALQLARGCVDPINRAASIGSLVPHAPVTQRAELLEESLAAARLEHLHLDWRASFLSKFAVTNSADDQLGPLLLDALDAQSPSAQKVIVARLLSLNNERLRTLLSSAFDVLANKKRTVLFDFLSIAAPLFQKISGPANDEVARAVVDVVQYFP
jgi:hypothetical protein